MIANCLLKKGLDAIEKSIIKVYFQIQFFFIPKLLKYNFIFE